MTVETQAPWHETAAGTGSGATATKSGQSLGKNSIGRTHVVTNISGHVDADQPITIESPAGTILWEKITDVSVEGFSFDSGKINIFGAAGADIIAKIANSTANCQINFSGYTR
jgi:molybdopterin-binding protein